MMSPLLLFSAYLNDKTEKAGIDRLLIANKTNAAIIEALSSLKWIKSSAREHETIRRQNINLTRMLTAQERDVQYQSAMNSVPEAFIVLVIVIIIFTTQNYKIIVPADFILFMILIFRAQRFLTLAQTMRQKMFSHLPSYITCLEMMNNASAQKESTQKSDKTIDGFSSLSLQNVSFSYHPDTPILSDVDLVIPARGMIAITGVSGAGKTTLTDLLSGLVSPTSGRILIDGQDFSEIDLLSWRKNIAYVPQDPVLFNDTILENIRYGLEHLDTNNIEKSLIAANAYEFVKRMPAGLDTVVGDRGSFLSGGQRQRIALARAFVSKPLMMILDEPTSALDDASDQAICNSLMELKKYFVIVSIAHRESTINLADAVYKIEHGKLRLVRKD